jgi:hypothetical protein
MLIFLAGSGRATRQHFRRFAAVMPDHLPGDRCIISSPPEIDMLAVGAAEKEWLTEVAIRLSRELGRPTLAPLRAEQPSPPADGRFSRWAAADSSTS